MAKRRIGARLGSPATAGEGTQNLLCAYLAMAVFAGLAANTLWGAWWLDGVVALGDRRLGNSRRPAGLGRAVVRLRIASPGRLADILRFPGLASSVLRLSSVIVD